MSPALRVRRLIPFISLGKVGTKSVGGEPNWSSVSSRDLAELAEGKIILWGSDADRRVDSTRRSNISAEPGLERTAAAGATRRGDVGDAVLILVVLPLLILYGFHGY
ncbi:unnamed protein product [Calypogeia fissa]